MGVESTQKSQTPLSYFHDFLGVNKAYLATFIYPPIQIARSDPAFLPALLDILAEVLIVRIARAVVLVQPLLQVLARRAAESSVACRLRARDKSRRMDIHVLHLAQELQGSCCELLCCGMGGHVHAVGRVIVTCGYFRLVRHYCWSCWSFSQPGMRSREKDGTAEGILGCYSRHILEPQVWQLDLS